MTSKIRSIHDLENCLHKYGYRGEALASICELSRTMHITSRSSSCLVTYEKVFREAKPSTVSRSEEDRPCHGMTVTLNDFLYNIPVRRKKVSEHFDSEEIRCQLEYLALVHPKVSMSFKNDVTGKMLLESRRSESTKDVFSQLFGPVLADHLEEINFSDQNGLSVHGFVSTRGHYNKSYQFIYVNCR